VTDYRHPLVFGTMLEAPAGRPLEVLGLADEAERVGLDVVSLSDHPYWPQRLDTFTLLAAMATRTKRIRLLSNVANLPLRPPISLARSALTLALLSDRRFELGLGTGAQQLWDEIVAEGGPRLSAGESVRALEEAVHVIRTVWSPSPSVDFHGRHYHLQGTAPSPVAGDIPIWIGAYGPRMLRLTGRVADGWIVSSPFCSPKELAVANQRIDEAADAAGRSPSAVRRAYNIAVDFGTTGATGFLQGPPNMCAEQLAELTLIHGISVYLLFRTASATCLARFAEEVAPAVRERVEAERDKT
jgi:alkanesulfonate monooxygenase SsuD/methylene tetrahydromethanopterin reductase-like flavin-dependent oxidoreductase (luciferase family)